MRRLTQQYYFTAAIKISKEVKMPDKSSLCMVVTPEDRHGKTPQDKELAAARLASYQVSSEQHNTSKSSSGSQLGSYPTAPCDISQHSTLSLNTG